MKVIGIFLGLLFMLSGVFAVSGVSPASYEINFEPGYTGEFIFDFVLEGGGSAELYAEGSLKEYVSFDRDKISGRERVVAYLNLPSEINSPGVNYVRIGAVAEGVDIGGVIKVSVLYPEKYVDVGLNAPNANVGDIVVLGLELFGRGNESVIVSPVIDIHMGDNVVESLYIGEIKIFPKDEINMNISLDTTGYSTGDYLAIASLGYGEDSAIIKNPFRLGEFSVNLLDYTKYFRENKIEKFEILIESLWDDNMDDVYVEVIVLNYPSLGFATSPEQLQSWEKKNFFGYLDVSGIKEGSFDAEVILHYGGETISEVVELNVIRGFDYIFWIVVLLIVVVVIFIIRRGFLFVQRLNKHKRK